MNDIWGPHIMDSMADSMAAPPTSTKSGSTSGKVHSSPPVKTDKRLGYDHQDLASD